MRRSSVDEYHQLGALGVLAEAERVELLEGLIVQKVIHNPPHDACVAIVDEIVRTRLLAVWHTRVQSAITTEDSEPAPDVAIVRGVPRDYLVRHPSSVDISLVVEVSESSLHTDRHKQRIYARASITCYWIINLVDAQIEVYSDPTGPAESPHYRTQQVYAANQSMAIAIKGVDVGAILCREMLP